jgi:transposase
MSFPLDPPQRKGIARRRQQTRDYRLGMRLSVLLWRDDGRTEPEIAQRLGGCERTLRNWLRLYRKQGLEALCLLHSQGDPGERTSTQAEQRKAEIQTGRCRCARQVREWLQATFQVGSSLSGTQRLRQRLGCSFHKTTGFLCKANRDQQEEFVQQYAADHPAAGAATRRYFGDACHPLWGLEFIYRCWWLRGQRFLVGLGGGRKRLNILGAYSPQAQEYLDLRVPKGTVSAAQVIELRTRLQQRHPETQQFILYLDNARYQHARAVRAWVEAQKAQGVEFVLDFLPAYSPNLILIERLWKFLRKRALQQWHPTYEAMQTAVARVLDHLEDFRVELTTLMTEGSTWCLIGQRKRRRYGEVEAEDYSAAALTKLR